MFFYVSKILWALVDPSNVVVILSVAGAALAFTRWRRIGRILAVAGAGGLILFGISPLSKLIISPLENRFPITKIDTRVDGIIVLGGVGLSRKQVSFYDGGSRIIAAIQLAQKHPGAKLAFSGGNASLLQGGDDTEADAAALLFRVAGISSERIILESRSRNTRENALYTKNLVDIKLGERWLLVTSAFHMPRAIACFRIVGLQVEAYPVDFRTSGDLADILIPFRHFADGLRLTNRAATEWVGLLVYWMMGYTHDLFPLGPKIGELDERTTTDPRQAT